jgi:menaquinone-dependent protoporphyrinogen oxidase
VSNILLVCSTVDGQTLKICQRLLARLTEQGNTVNLWQLSTDFFAVEKSLASADKIIIGGSIRYGKHSKLLVKFVEHYHQVLNRKNSAFFSVNVVARKAGKNTVATNPYVGKFLKHIVWQPQKVAIFAGKIDYPRYRFFDKHIIRMIMWLTKGPTDLNAVIEYTDWQQVDEFTDTI